MVGGPRQAPPLRQKSPSLSQGCFIASLPFAVLVLYTLYTVHSVRCTLCTLYTADCSVLYTKCSVLGCTCATVPNEGLLYIIIYIYENRYKYIFRLRYDLSVHSTLCTVPHMSTDSDIYTCVLHMPNFTNSGYGRREVHKNWSIVILEKAAPVTGTALRTTGLVPATCQQ